MMVASVRVVAVGSKGDGWVDYANQGALMD